MGVYDIGPWIIRCIFSWGGDTATESGSKE